MCNIEVYQDEVRQKVINLLKISSQKLQMILLLLDIRMIGVFRNIVVPYNPQSLNLKETMKVIDAMSRQYTLTPGICSTEYDSLPC